MKNVSSKILILAASFIGVVVAVLVFVKTVVSPPVDVEFVDEHQQKMIKALDSFTSSKKIAFNDSLYDACIDKIAVFADNGLISQEQTDYDKQKLINAYVPLFKSECFRQFSESGWSESCFRPMRKRIEALRSVKLSSKSPVVQGTNASDLKSIEDVMSDYASAKSAANARTFHDVSSTRRSINTAAQYLETQYIKISNLKSSLERVQPSLEESHYRHVSSEVNRLSGYRNMSQENFDKLVSSVNATINEYDNNKSMYGRYARDISSLKSNAGNTISTARQYYLSLQKPTITISSLGGWSSWYDSANPTWNGYRSSSNYHVANSDARMSFTIKGYDQFSFWVRSSSESCCDYLMASHLDQYSPTYDNCQYTTKSKDDANTWKEVKYYGLNKATTYTIYVVYHKDSSYDSGDDRAYILLPKN